MKQHILTALREEFARWEELLAGMSEEQITAPQLPANWSVQDVMAHLWAWQQRSIARLEAALDDREPEFPRWPEADPDSEDSPDRTNAWIYATNRELPWSSVYQNWRGGFLRFVELAEAILEKDLLNAERYAWMHGYPLALVLLSSYEHHHVDHYGPLLARLRRTEPEVRRGMEEGTTMLAPSVRPGTRANRSMPPGTIIPELAYPDLDAAVAWLSRTFGFRERLRIENHRSQLVFGGESVIVVARSAGHASETADAARAAAPSVTVRVADVDAHYEHAKASGARILHPPETYEYGERQYTVQDLAGHPWTFSQSVADVAPEQWGGRLVGGAA